MSLNSYCLVPTKISPKGVRYGEHGDQSMPTSIKPGKSSTVTLFLILIYSSRHLNTCSVRYGQASCCINNLVTGRSSNKSYVAVWYCHSDCSSRKNASSGNRSQSLWVLLLIIIITIKNKRKTWKYANVCKKNVNFNSALESIVYVFFFLIINDAYFKIMQLLFYVKHFFFF